MSQLQMSALKGMQSCALKSAVRPICASRSRTVSRGSRVVVKAEASSESDFDALLIKVADKFEKAENKPAVIGYSAAALGAFFFAEWLIHLPALDILLGFPIQLVGVLVLPLAITRYVLDSKDITEDLSGALESVVTKLPGLEKK